MQILPVLKEWLLLLLCIFIITYLRIVNSKKFWKLQKI